MQYIDVHTHIYKPEENIISIENTVMISQTFRLVIR